ncbi:BAG family molecular chaperone regulator 4-like [Mercurialis annua]|uniref:BAG family molecular chaperone regulator 4-like n=1 Tax=Mercurialis annua TaxID=3986 RepID=UPI0021604132|nr:BAG family molecular chaperone regulator 4-like [Mercurialis annua]
MKNSSSDNDQVHVNNHGGTGNDGPFINIHVSHGQSNHQIYVPSHSTFGYVKEVIAQEVGLDPDQQKVLFRGKEKEDWEYLNEAGVKDKSKILVLENRASAEKGETSKDDAKDSGESSKADAKGSGESSKADAKGSGETSKADEKQSEEMLKAFQSIAAIREEVDKLAERVSVLEVAVNSGTKVANEEFAASAELLMRQLLKLDTIEAEGEAKMQRKAEVRRVQNFHDLLDNLKSSNSKPVGNNGNTVSVTTEWETFDSGVGSLNPPPVSPSTRITEDWERFD